MSTFSTLKQIEAGVLNVGYAEDGPSDGRAVMLLHGWPYDIQVVVVGRMMSHIGGAWRQKTLYRFRLQSSIFGVYPYYSARKIIVSRYRA